MPRPDRRDLLPAIADALAAYHYRVSLAEHGAVLLYRASPTSRIGSVRVLPYCVSPLLWRWHIDHYLVHVNRRSYEELGGRRREWAPGPKPPRGVLIAANAGGKLELTVTPDQLERAALYVPDWIGARDAHEPPPAAPWPLYVERPVLDYAWTADAHALYEDARQRATG